MAAALAYRDFRLLWFGALVSSIGTWMQKVAQAWLIVTLTGSASAFFLGLDSFVGEVPILLFTLIGGVVAGRATGRNTRDSITLFKSVGLAIEDVALGATLLERARAQAVGRELPF